MMVFAEFIWGFVREKRYGLCNIFVLLFEFELCSWSCVCGFEAMGNPKSQRVEKEVVVYVLPRGN